MRSTHAPGLLLTAGAALLLTACGTPTSNGAPEPASQRAADTPAAAAPAAPSLPGNEGWAGITEIAAGYAAPGPLTAPAEAGQCPDAADSLTASLGTRTVYWQGQLPGVPGCAWADVDTVTGQTLIEQRYSVGIGFYEGISPEDLGFYLQDGGIRPCSVIDAPLGEELTALTRCTSSSSDGSRGTGDTSYTWFQPDSSGTGVWALRVTVGAQYPGDLQALAAAGLAAVTQVAVDSYGAR